MDYIDIALAPDNNYAMQCSVVIASIFDNVTTPVRIHILSADLSDVNKSKISKLFENTIHKCLYYDMSKFDFSNLPLNRDYISIATYYRLKILNIIPDYISKIIYLDCDIIVKKDIKELWEIDLENNVAGVVEDEISLTNIKKLNLPTENNYFNAGVLILDLEKLRHFDFENKFIHYYEKNKDIITCQDQDILNGIFNGYCKYLPIYWNTDGRVYSLDNSENNKTVEEMQYAISNPGIIHYTFIYKPWMFSCKHKAKNEWWKYLLKTSFKNYRYKYCFSIINIVLNKIFSIKNTNKNIVITILGIKMSFRKL